MDHPTPCLVFTDLDGTLMNGETYAYQAAVPTIQSLRGLGIPVIPVTSKTRREVETWRQAIGLADPFIVENGSAIFMPRQNTQFSLPDGDDDGDYRVVQLGCPYVVARAGLKAIALGLGRPLKGFGDWGPEQIVTLTGLSVEDAKAAKAREFSEPFMTPKNVTRERLSQVVTEMGFRVVIGDRFSHLIGSEAGKGRAVEQLVALYEAAHPDQPRPTTVGLGNSPNDLDMLEHVDHPIVMPGAKGPHPELAERGWEIAPAVAPEGWRLAVEQVLSRV